MKSGICCNLCGSSDIKRLYALKEDHISREKECILYVEKCGKCGLIFVSNAGDTDEAHQTFWKEVVKDISAKFEGISSTDYEDKAKLIDKYRDNNKVLDIGCGDGQFLKVLKERGWNEFGVEVSRDAVDYARNKLNLNVVQGMAEDMDFPDDYFDVVLMWGVIEHLRDPQAVLEKVGKFLRKGGLLLLYLPNVNSFFSQIGRVCVSMFGRENQVSFTQAVHSNSSVLFFPEDNFKNSYE